MNRSFYLGMLLGVFVLVPMVASAKPRPTPVPTTCTRDRDCSDGTFCNGRERCMPGAPGTDARGCMPSPGPACAADQTCNEQTNRCEVNCGQERDADHDGVAAIACGGTDCDDADPNRYPGNPEVCVLSDPGHDEDCNPQTFGNLDADHDGHVDSRCFNSNASGSTYQGDDCDDSNPNIHPSQPEVCNGVDDNCDGRIDDVEMVYPDNDRDGFGARVAGTKGCPGQFSSLQNNDCDDTLPGIHPGSVSCVAGGAPNEILMCNYKGSLQKGSCDSGMVCVVQPNSTGICEPAPAGLPATTTTRTEPPPFIP